MNQTGRLYTHSIFGIQWSRFDEYQEKNKRPAGYVTFHAHSKIICLFLGEKQSFMKENIVWCLEYITSSTHWVYKGKAQWQEKSKLLGWERAETHYGEVLYHSLKISRWMQWTWDVHGTLATFLGLQTEGKVSVNQDEISTMVPRLWRQLSSK